MEHHNKIIKKNFLKKFNDYLNKNKNKNESIKWEIFKYSVSFPLDFFMKNLDLFGKVDLKFISYHPCLDLDFLIKYNDINYDWNFISRKIKMTLKEYYERYDLYNLNNKNNIKIQHVYNNLNKFSDLNNDDKPPSFDNLFIINELTYEEIMDLNVSNLLTYFKSFRELIEAYKKGNHSFKTFNDKLTCLTENDSFVFEYYMEKLNYYTRIIQNWWMEYLLNPYHKVGEKYINKKFDKII